ncbi:MAG: hypothetical protein KC776_30185 [Myxococcales bacterium]|nr:hypothetical protein [Myxococcales bacterium]
MFRRGGLLLAVVLVACTGRRGARAPEVNPAQDVAQLQREVSAIRGLSERRPARISVDDPKSFARALELKAQRDAIPPTAEDTVGFSLAFDFPPPGARQGSSADDVIGEQVVGFYDRTDNSIHVRGDSYADDPDEARLVLAHELAHSLQVQNLPMPPLAEAKDSDTRLASMAVLEGDAMLVMLAHAAYRYRVPLSRALARAAVAASDEALERYLRANKADQMLKNAPPMMRERLMFPYMRGLTFVGDLWRAGGFELVNRMFAHPPSTTEQVIHPEKYLAGEGAVAVDPPAAPEGYERLVTGRVGELATRVILSRCVDKNQAATAAAGWGGDAFSIVKSASGPGLLWATTWDDEREAQEFEVALRSYVACTRKQAAETVMPAGDVVRRQGQTVVLTRGFGGRDATTALLTLPHAPETPTAPLGAVTIPPKKIVPKVPPPYVSAGVYVNPKLGLMARVPPGASIEMPSATSAMFSMHGRSPALAGIELSDRVAAGDTIDQIHASLADAMKHAIGDAGELEYIGGQDISLPSLGRGVLRSWRVKQTSVGLSAIVLPVCRGTGSFVFWRIWVDPSGAALLDQWLASVRPTAWREPPICAELDP